MRVKVKKLVESAVIPSYAKDGDAGMDLTAVSKQFDEGGNVVYGTGLAFEIPKGYMGLIFPRSSNAKKELILSNSVGVIDSGYRGEVMLKFKPSVYFAGDRDNPESLNQSEKFDFITSGKPSMDYEDNVDLYEIGDRIGQIVILPYPHIEFEEVNELTDSVRGTGGYGSTNIIMDEVGKWGKNTTGDTNWSNAIWVNGDTAKNIRPGENAFGISQENYTSTGGVEFDNKNDSLGINHFTNTPRSKSCPDEEV